jgi:hypothetical protein
MYHNTLCMCIYTMSIHSVSSIGPAHASRSRVRQPRGCHLCWSLLMRLAHVGSHGGATVCVCVRERA